jgi:hypothetical protein
MIKQIELSRTGDRVSTNDSKLHRFLAAARNWRTLVQPNWPGNMTPHERELALAIDEMNSENTDRERRSSERGKIQTC